MRCAVALVVLVALLRVPEAAAMPSSFNESPGCGAPAGVRGPYADRPGFVAADQVIAGPWGDYYGRTVADVEDRLVRMELPTTGGDADNVVYVHERVAPALQQVIDTLVHEQHQGRYYRISVTSSYRPYTVPPKQYLSFHAVGAAVDVNPADNPYREDNVLITDLPDWFVHAWTDAGWCWGGAWQDLKDPQHFSWMGPLHADGHPAFDPYPPVTDPAPFDRSITFRSAIEGDLFGDVDRDGAPDVLAVGASGIVAAPAGHRYETCRALGPVPSGREALLLGDGTGDGRPDLWTLDRSGPTAAITAATFASGYRETIGPIDTHVAAGSTVLAGDYDRDGRMDLYEIRPGSPTVVAIWRGPGFGVARVADLPAASGPGYRYALGDRHGDGIADLFALDGTGRLHVFDGASGFGVVEEIDTTITGPGTLHAADWDGDGRADLAVVDGDLLTVHLGGDQGDRSDAELTGWFSAPPAAPWADGQPWAPGDGCPREPGSMW